MAVSKLKVDKVLIWTNPRPNETFSAQTVSLDLSAYKAIEIETKVDASLQLFTNPQVINKDTSATANWISCTSFSGYYIQVNARGIDVSSTGVTFGDAATMRGNNIVAATTNNARLVPYKIYGIK